MLKKFQICLIQHHEIKLKPQDFLSQLPAALNATDHPSGDGPNTYVVSKATKEAGITMALSGLGGDELFAGYDVFIRMKSVDSKSYLNIFPSWLRALPASHWLAGAVDLMASLQYKSAIGGQGWVEMDTNANRQRSEVFPSSWAVRDGAIALPELPGLIPPLAPWIDDPRHWHSDDQELAYVD